MADVLIAEDDADIREWVALALTKAHYRVRTVADGAAALVAYAERRPDILILDIMMPRKSGYDVCIEVRRGGDSVPISAANLTRSKTALLTWKTGMM